MVVAEIVAAIIEELGEDPDPQKIAWEIERRTFNMRRKAASSRIHADAHRRSRQMTREAVDRESEAY